jgi:hypothetical protein
VAVLSATAATAGHVCSSRTALGLPISADHEHIGYVDAHEVTVSGPSVACVADVFASVSGKDQRAKGDCYLRGTDAGWPP